MHSNLRNFITQFNGMKEAIKLLAIGISVCSLAYIRHPFIDREYTHSQKATEVSREEAKHQLYS